MTTKLKMFGLRSVHLNRGIRRIPPLVGSPGRERLTSSAIIPSLIPVNICSESRIGYYAPFSSLTSATTPFHENPVYFLSHLKTKQRGRRLKESKQRRKLRKDEERRQKRRSRNEWKRRQANMLKEGEMRHQVFMEYIQKNRDQKIDYVKSAEEERRQKRSGLTETHSFQQNPRSVHYQRQAEKLNQIVQSKCVEPSSQNSNGPVTTKTSLDYLEKKE